MANIIDLNAYGPQIEPRKDFPRELDQRPRIESALSVLDSDCDRDTWVRIGQAIQNELGEEGFPLWDDWSRSGSSYSETSSRETWRSFGQGRGITSGTLFKLAQEYGWSDTVPAREMSPEEVDARRNSREEAARKNEEEALRVQVRAREWSAAIVTAAQPARPDHPYLVRKGVSPAPTMMEIDAANLHRLTGYAPKANGEALSGRLIVIPLERFDGTGPCTVELIDESGRKSALAGPGTKSGAHGRLDDFQGIPDVVLIGEGAATTMTALEAISGHNAAAFMASSASNMPTVARSIRAQYPEASIIVLADIVKTTGEPDQKAVDASRAVNGFLAVPDFGAGWTASIGTDFNDLARVRGPEAVLECINKSGRAELSIWDHPADIATMLATKPEPMKWLIQGRIPFARGGVITALGGTGKTTLLKVLAIGCIIGRVPMTDWIVERTGKVVLVLTEDTHVEFHEDIHQMAMGMTTRERELLVHNLIVFPLAGKDTRLLVKSPRGAVERSMLYKSLVSKIQSMGDVVLVGLDPALGISEGEEMAQEDQRALGRAVDDLAVNCEATCTVLSHSAKGILAADELNSHSSRGGGALTDALRFEITMRGMTAKDAFKYGITDLAERNALVQVAITKGNRIPPAAKVPVWLKYDSGTLISAGLVESANTCDGGTRLNKGARLVFEALRQTAMESGLVVDGEFCGVDMDQWQRVHEDMFYAANPAHSSRAGGQAFGRGVAKLVDAGMVRVEGSTVFFDGPGSEIHTQNVMGAIEERRAI